MMKVYMKVLIVFLTLTCVAALTACNDAEEKKQTNSTSENSTKKRAIRQKRVKIMRTPLRKKRKSLWKNQKVMIR